MVWKIIALLAIKAKSAMSWAIRGVRAYPWQVACLVLAMSSWAVWSAKNDAIAQRENARVALRAEKEGRKADRAEWNRQVATAKAAKEAAERKSKEIANDAQASHDALAADNAGLRNYIASRSLRATGGAAIASRTADYLGPALPAAATANALVAADESDLVSCDQAYIYAASAHEWVQNLISLGLASPPN